MPSSRVEKDLTITWGTLPEGISLTDRDIEILDAREGRRFEEQRVPIPQPRSLWARLIAMAREWFTDQGGGEDDSEAMWETNPELFLTVMAAASALAEEYDICHKDICIDMSHLGAEMLKDAGYDAFVVCHSWRTNPGETAITVPSLAHCWVRAENDWHIDFGAVQFPELAELPYPLITHREGYLTAGIYGEGASQIKLRGEYGRVGRKSVRPPLVDVSRVLQSETLQELEALWERNWTGDPVRSFLAFQKFREILNSIGLTDKGIPSLARDSVEG